MTASQRENDPMRVRMCACSFIIYMQRQGNMSMSRQWNGGVKDLN